MTARPALRKAVSTDPAANGLLAESAVACDFSLRGALPDLCHDRFKPCQTALPVLLLHTLFTRWRLGCGWLLRDRRRCHFRSSVCGLRHLSQQTMMRYQSTQQSLAHIVKKVPSISHLNRVRRGFRRRLGIQTGSIPTDDLGSRMSPQPLRGTLRAAVRQQIDDLATFQVKENRAVATSLAPRLVVDAQYPKAPVQKRKSPCGATDAAVSDRWPKCPTAPPGHTLGGSLRQA